jgi:molybdenum cofactor guanylyltransferase
MKISAVLVAGGQSRRMGKDKATLLFHEKPLWQIQLELLRKLEPEEIFVSARTNPIWRPDDVQFVADDAPSRGPMSGLAASLTKMRSKHLLALGIDMPFMTEKYLKFLCDQVEPGCGVMAKIEDRFEPLAAIYPQEALPNVRSALTSADFSLQTLARQLIDTGKLRSIRVSKEAREFFWNMNQPADVQSR